MFVPNQSKLPCLDSITVEHRGNLHQLPCLIREGSGGPSILFVHGLGGCKENFYSAIQSPALSTAKIVAFDEPGTGLASFDPSLCLTVTDLADIANSVAQRLLPEPFFLAGASMGGLIVLLQLRRHGVGRIQGLINLEGNLESVDCMFSRRVVPHSLSAFEPVYVEMMNELYRSRYVGDQLVAQNMALNVDIRAYHAYSFEAVSESDSGMLIEEFLKLPIPRLFLYGEANSSLPYLERLRSSPVEVVEVSSAAHFLFYDNPVETFEAIGNFVNRYSCDKR